MSDNVYALAAGAARREGWDGYESWQVALDFLDREAVGDPGLPSRFASFLREITGDEAHQAAGEGAAS